MGRRKAVVLDFDGTLTRYGVYLVDIVNTRTRGALRRDLERIDARYRPKAMDHTITSAEEREWGMRTFSAYIAHGLTRADIRSALDGIVLRPGVASCLDGLSAAGVPFAVVSFGFKPFIDVVLENAGYPPGAFPVYAVEFAFGPDGAVEAFDIDTYVLPERKGEVSRSFAALHGIHPRDILAVGDSSGDRTLGHLKRNRLGICESDERRPLLAPYFGRIMVLPDGHFGPASAWLARRLGKDLT